MTCTRTIALYTATGATAYCIAAGIVEAEFGIHLLPMPFDRAALMATIGMWLTAAMAHCLQITLTAQAGIEARMVERLVEFEKRLYNHIDAWGVDALLSHQRNTNTITAAVGQPRRPSPHRSDHTPPGRPPLRSVN